MTCSLLPAEIFPLYFSTSTTPAVGYSPYSVAVGDLNGDGKLDFATANSNGSNVTVGLGNDTGTGFAICIIPVVGHDTHYGLPSRFYKAPYFVAIGDFNADGKPDLATANFWGDNVTVLLGDGTGTGFATSTTLAVGRGP